MRFLCTDCGTGFESAFEEMLDVTVLVAEYGRTWQPCQRPVPVAELSSAYVSRAGQHAIRALDYGRARAILEGLGAAPFWDLSPGGESRSIPGGHVPAMGKSRVGQQRFREEMLARFGPMCAVTGPQPAAALEAAHLYRYSIRPEHDIQGGLLLRRDLHALHERWLLTIDPATWRVHVAPDLLQFPALAELDGQELRVPSRLRPRRSLRRIPLGAGTVGVGSIDAVAGAGHGPATQRCGRTCGRCFRWVRVIWPMSRSSARRPGPPTSRRLIRLAKLVPRAKPGSGRFYHGTTQEGWALGQARGALVPRDIASAFAQLEREVGLRSGELVAQELADPYSRLDAYGAAIWVAEPFYTAVHYATTEAN